MTRHVRSVELGAPYMAEGIEFTTVWIKGQFLKPGGAGGSACSAKSV